MELHEQLATAIARADLRYVAGTCLNAPGHPRGWVFTQWGTMVAFEAAKHLNDVHGIDLGLRWEQTVAAAARHGGKYFDGRRNQLGAVVADFEALLVATHVAFFPEDRRGRAFDFLRDDFSVVTDGDRLLLTNVTGHFMMGLPPDRALNTDQWGPHARELTIGIGNATASFTDEGVEAIREHGSSVLGPATWRDGKIARDVPTAFGGELQPGLTLALLSIASTMEGARRWAKADCCVECAVAALKHRFIVLHHGVQSLRRLAEQPTLVGAVGERYLSEIATVPSLNRVIEQPLRNLRNGWLHLGLSDIADRLPGNVSIITPIEVYAGLSAPELSDAVDEGLEVATQLLQNWMLEADEHGETLYTRLQAADGDDDE